LLIDFSLKKLMQTKSHSTIVIMPDNSNLEVDYYCMDTKLNETEKKKLTQLFIQLRDCICTLKIEKSLQEESCFQNFHIKLA
jgi:hypothetical protein